jgi:hypothetical protein
MKNIITVAYEEEGVMVCNLNYKVIEKLSEQEALSLLKGVKDLVAAQRFDHQIEVMDLKK